MNAYTSNRRLTVLVIAALGLFVLAGCNNLQEQPKLHDAYDESPTFGSAARVPLEEAVPVGFLNEDEHFYAGTVDGEFAEGFPENIEITRDLIARGQIEFESFCSPCHGYSGYGDGVLSQEGFPPPASYHTDDLRDAPAGRIYAAIANGKGTMYSYAARVEPEDRWAIVAYIRALQLSQHAEFAALPEDLQAEFDALEG